MAAKFQIDLGDSKLIVTLEKQAAALKTLTSQPTRFHMSLNVRDLQQTIDFFRSFFGVEPAKCRADYAKFELDDPPLVLSLEPFPAPPGGNLNHLGFRVASSEALVEVQRRLEIGGIRTRREEGVECCYARQTKFWVHDPDGNLWEVYTLDEDLEHRGDGHVPHDAPTSTSQPDAAASIWNHRLGEPFPARLPVLDATVDYVSLQGTFNEKLTPEQAKSRAAEIFRILKPGGTVQLHMLTADRDIGATPIKLPGPAALVQGVPVDMEMLALLAEAGFRDPRYILRGTNPCFHLGDAELRETRIEARKV